GEVALRGLVEPLLWAVLAHPLSRSERRASGRSIPTARGINTGQSRPWAWNSTQKELEMKNTQAQPRRWRRFRPTPALLIAFVALFAAMGGIGYSAAKLRPNSIRSKSIRDGAVTSNKLADGAVTTPKFAADAMAPSARNATNADMLGGVAPGGCQAG